MLIRDSKQNRVNGGKNMKSEGTQHIYNSLKNTVKVRVGDKVVDRCMEELGVIRGLEKDKVVNYILIPTRCKDKDGKDYTSAWNVHEIHTDDDTNFRFNEDENRWSKQA